MARVGESAARCRRNPCLTIAVCRLDVSLKGADRRHVAGKIYNILRSNDRREPGGAGNTLDYCKVRRCGWPLDFRLESRDPTDDMTALVVTLNVTSTFAW